MSNQTTTQEDKGNSVSALIQSSEKSSLMKPEPFDDEVVLSQPKLQIMAADSEEVINKEKPKSVKDSSLSCLMCIDACCEFLSQCWYPLFCCCEGGCGECLGGCCEGCGECLGGCGECAKSCGECATCCSDA